VTAAQEIRNRADMIQYIVAMIRCDPKKLEPERGGTRVLLQSQPRFFVRAAQEVIRR
jgi:hypothetical protein